jgi:hypothetical protein
VTRTWRRAAAGVSTVAVVALAALAVWTLTRPRSPEEPLAATRELVSRTTVSVAVDGSSLLAGRAIADFGVGAEVRLVRVRIVDELRLSIRLASDVDVGLGAAPRGCLVGPYSAPDDAGLSSPCWGEPDFGASLAARLAASPEGRPRLVGGQPVDLIIDLRRGDLRCDYAPGQWRLEVSLEPIVDGVSAGPVELPDVAFTIPFAADDRLVAVPDSRYCGLAETIYMEQGEPAIVDSQP